MQRNSYFQFKKFRVTQEKAAMKVNTDGVLLGAWVHLDGAKTVLDIGAGTGLISLMIAQRCNAQITGVEIEKNAAEEAIQNVLRSDWKNRILIQNISFQEFVQISKSGFDRIVSNPPFFSNGVKNANPSLSIARHNHLLPFTDIIEGTVKLLNEDGKLALILPIDQSVEIVEKAGLKGLFLHRITEVKPFPDRAPNRCLMEFGKAERVVQKSLLSVYDSTKSRYSEEFKTLAGDFYLNL